MTTASTDPERVRIAVGFPKEPDQKQVPVTIFDMESRRCKYQLISRDQLAVMNGDTMGEWTAIWSEKFQEWKLVDFVSDMKRKAVA